MLLQFAVQNYRSVADRVVLSMLSADDVDAGGRVHVEGVGKVLTTAAIYGANASGKTTIARAWDLLCRLATEGVPPGSVTGSIPFKLDDTRIGQPTQLEAHLRVGGVTWAYGIAFTPKQVVREWLTHHDGTTEASVFDRESGNPKPRIVYGPGLARVTPRTELYGYIAEGTRNEQPLLAELRARNAYEFEPLTAFLNISTASGHLKPSHESGGVPIENIQEIVAAFPEERTRVRTILAAADTGVTDVALSANDPEFQKRLDSGEPIELSDVNSFVDDGGKLEFEFVHRKTPLAFAELSSGTQRLLGLAIGLGFLHSAKQGGGDLCLFVDELDRSFHTQLTMSMIELAMSYCDVGAQLLFTTHDTNILDADLLGADAIWFAQKNDHGATELYSLAEFDPAQLKQLKGQLERGYLDGRFGAIPDVSKVREVAKARSEHDAAP